MYIGNLKSEKLQFFLRFNGNTNEEMMAPIGHTCTEEFEVSRFITFLEQLSRIMDKILLNSENTFALNII